MSLSSLEYKYKTVLLDKMDKIKLNNRNRILSILLSQWKCLKYRWSTFFIHASGYTVNNQIYVCQSLMPKNSYWVTWKIYMTCMLRDGKMGNYAKDLIAQPFNTKLFVQCNVRKLLYGSISCKV